LLGYSISAWICAIRASFSLFILLLSSPNWSNMNSSPARINAVIDPWIIWNVVVESAVDLFALDVNDYRLGAIALVLRPGTATASQAAYEMSETSPGINNWLLTKQYIDTEWHDRDPFLIDATNEVALQASSTLQAAFLFLEPGFTPTDP
jgi:hypothetical protein